MRILPNQLAMSEAFDGWEAGGHHVTGGSIRTPAIEAPRTPRQTSRVISTTRSGAPVVKPLPLYSFPCYFVCFGNGFIISARTAEVCRKYTLPRV